MTGWGRVWRGARMAGLRRTAGIAAIVAAGLGPVGVGSAGAQELTISRFLVDTPTAGVLPAGAFETQARIFPGGGLELRLDIGLARWLSLGGAYGGVQVIGDGEPDWYPEPGFTLKVRVLEESWTIPALALGIDTQGAGFWDEGRERFQFKSRGVYAVASKNYAWFGDLTFHGGISRSLEQEDDSDLTPFAGIEKSIGGAFGAAVEYDLGTNDDRKDGVYGKGRGYLNGVIRWSVAQSMEVRFVLRDMLDNSETVDPQFRDVVADEGWGRELSFSYMESF